MEGLAVLFPNQERSVGKDQFLSVSHTDPHVAESCGSPAAPRPFLSGGRPLLPSTTDVGGALVGAGAADVASGLKELSV